MPKYIESKEGRMTAVTLYMSEKEYELLTKIAHDLDLSLSKTARNLIQVGMSDAKIFQQTGLLKLARKGQKAIAEMDLYKDELFDPV